MEYGILRREEHHVGIETASIRTDKGVASPSYLPAERDWIDSISVHAGCRGRVRARASLKEFSGRKKERTSVSLLSATETLLTMGAQTNLRVPCRPELARYMNTGSERLTKKTMLAANEAFRWVLSYGTPVSLLAGDHELCVGVGSMRRMTVPLPLLPL